MDVLPGDPASVILGTGARPDTLAALRHEMGLDQPVAVRYAAWIGGILAGDFGRSLTYHVPVSELIAQRAAISAPLAAAALAFSAGIAVPLGVWAASRRGSAADTAAMAAAQLGVAAPNFWLGLLLVLAFAIMLPWLPSGGFPGWRAGFLPAARALLLPTVALALPQAAILARVTRSAVIETLSEDFVRAARARGRSRRGALWSHALPNAAGPILTILGLQFGFLLSGAVLIESVFSLPGLGRLLFQAIAQRDLIVVQSLVLLFSATVIVVNFLVDLAQAALDPRLRG